MRNFALYALLLLTPTLAVRSFTRSSSALEWAVDLTLLAHLAWFCLRAAAGALSAIGRERELGTWEALCCTLLTPAEIYRGKLGSVLRPLLPCLALFALVTGARSSIALPLVILTAVYAWFFASLGLYASLRSRSTHDAGRLTWGLLALVSVAPVLGTLAQAAAGHEARFGPSIALCPPLTFMSLYVSDRCFHDAADVWRLSAALYASLAFLFTALGLRLTARPLPDRQVPRRRRRALDHLENPIAYRQACGQSPLTSAVGLALLCLGATAVLAGSSAKRDQAYLLLTFAAEVYLCLRAVAAGVGTIAGEREKRTLEVLLASPLRPAQILRAKARTAFVPVLRDLAALSLFTVAAGLYAEFPPLRVVESLLLMLASVLFFGCLGLWYSARESTTLKAVQKAYLVLGMLTLGTLGFDVALSDIHHNAVAFLWVNPVMAMLGTSLLQWEDNFWAARWLAPVCCTLYLLGAAWCYRGAYRRLGQI